MADINNDLRTKKKNVCDTIIFEVDLNDCSPEHSPKRVKDCKDEECAEKCGSQDSGFFNQETKILSQENEFCGPESPECDGNNKIDSSCVTDNGNPVVEEEINTNSISVESGSCIVVDDFAHADDSKVTDHSNKVEESNEVSVSTKITETQKIDVDSGEMQTTVECFSINFIEKTEETIEDEKQKNTVECFEITEIKEIVDNEVSIKTDSVEPCKNLLNECDNVDEMKVDDVDESDANLSNECATVENKPEVLEVSKDLNACSIISISFKDAATAKEYKPHFLKFLHAYPELNVVETSEHNLTLQVLKDPDLPADKWIVMDETFGESLATRSRKRKRSERKKEKDLFMVDTSPSIVTKENSSLRYLSKFSVSVNEEEQQKDDDVVKGAGATCFNCDGNHSLKDCTEPKNYSKINMARNSYKSSQTKSARYHLEEDQMYSHLVPGKISEKLRKALGLHKSDIPPYIYRMRLLGYPPGWIKEAEEEASNLCMFDIEGKNVSNNKRKKTSIDPEKIVSYPGFNAPMEKGTYDDYKYYGVPPFSAGHDKQVMIEFINKMRAREEDDFEVCEMDVDKSFEETVVETSENDISQDDSQFFSKDETQLNSRASPTLIDLETRKQQLLAELDTNTTSDSSKSCEQDAKESNAVVKMSSFGTPILKSGSPYSKLPKPDNFSQNISPVINFENLPNATGKYEQMTGILQKVRTALKGLQGERKT